ncbi:unnamed protein product [Choristocarpus tenellus]
MPTSVGGLDLSSMKHRQHAAFVGSLVANSPHPPSKVARASWRVLLTSCMYEPYNTGLRIVHPHPPFYRRPLRRPCGNHWPRLGNLGGTTPPAPAPEVHILAAHDTRIRRRAQHEITCLLNKIRFDSFRTQLAGLPNEAHQGRESSSLALARHRSRCGQGSNVWASTQPLEPACQIAPLEFKLTVSRSLGREEAYQTVAQWQGAEGRISIPDMPAPAPGQGERYDSTLQW